LNQSDILFIIPARGGSKGIPGKNIKKLNGKPLITYSIDIARKFVADEFICISTDSEEIIGVVENYGLQIPFKRPNEIATDTSGSHEVIIHALDWYKHRGLKFEKIVLLQPTSPFRLKKHIEEALALYNADIDMVASVKKVKSNISATYYSENNNAFIEKVFSSDNIGIRRQDAKEIYELNGSIYVINVDSVRQNKLGEFMRVKKTVMEDIYSVDIDDMLDWKWCEFIVQEKLVHF